MNHIIIDQVATYYNDKIDRFGKTAEGVDWNSIASQEIRFCQLSKLLPNDYNKRFSLCDFGCGIGDYCGYLNRFYHYYSYIGLDISPKMIAKANKYPNASYKCDSNLDAEYDFIVTSGIFNVKQNTANEEWLNYILEILNMFNAHAKIGFAFNCLTKYSDKEHMRDYLYYADPLYLFDYCKKHFSKDVALLHDYKIYDFTILVRKEL